MQAQDRTLKNSVPFAVVSGTHTLEVNGKKLRGRQYPWGFVEVDNIKHSDFALLRRFIIQTHMQDLKDVTHDVHYENYRQVLRVFYFCMENSLNNRVRASDFYHGGGPLVLSCLIIP